jgi:hypothetical protein
MFEQIAITAIGCILAPIMTYAILKRTMKTEKILEISDELLTEITSNVEMQKKVYLIGVLVGKGIIDATGMKTGGGKFKLDNVIGQGIGMFIEQMFSGQKKESGESVNPFAQR